MSGENKEKRKTNKQKITEPIIMTLRKKKMKRNIKDRTIRAHNQIVKINPNTLALAAVPYQNTID